MEGSLPAPGLVAGSRAKGCERPAAKLPYRNPPDPPVPSCCTSSTRCPCWWGSGFLKAGTGKRCGRQAAFTLGTSLDKMTPRNGFPRCWEVCTLPRCLLNFVLCQVGQPEISAGLAFPWSLGSWEHHMQKRQN